MFGMITWVTRAIPRYCLGTLVIILYIPSSSNAQYAPYKRSLVKYRIDPTSLHRTQKIVNGCNKELIGLPTGAIEHDTEDCI